MSKEIMQFRGVTVGTNMSKEQLLEVITYLASEMNHWKKEFDDNADIIYAAKVESLGLA